MNQKNELYAVITGASGGLGKAYTIQLAQRGHNLILVGLPNEGLTDLANELSTTYKIRAVSYETDLTSTENMLALSCWINENYKISLLINNAGIGGSCAFLQANKSYISRIIQLNIMATSLLTRELLPNLLMQDCSFILNVSSIAAFIPTGFKTVYPASKSFIHSFSRGLNAELSGQGVSVCVVHPGPMRTNAEITSRIDKQGWFAKMLLNKPEKVARQSLEALFRKKSVVVPSQWALLLLRLIPKSIIVSLLTHSIKRELTT